MGAIASLITSLTIIFSTVYSDADQRKHESSASLAFVRGIHRGPVFPFDDVIMDRGLHHGNCNTEVCPDTYGVNLQNKRTTVIHNDQII